MLENLEMIKNEGIDALLSREEEKWKCPECGGVISCHNGICYTCGLEKLKSRKKKYYWTDD
jgi:rubrerythrin